MNKLNFLGTAFLMLFIANTSFGQFTTPRVFSITNETFVLVIRSSETQKVGEKVVMSDFKASKEDFDPNKMDSYPKWRIRTVNVSDKGAIKRHIALHCIDNNMYYNRKKGMLPAKEYDKYWEKDQTGNYKIKDRNEVYDFLFFPEIRDKEYIWLRINDKQAVTPGTWARRDIKLVLNSLK